MKHRFIGVAAVFLLGGALFAALGQAAATETRVAGLKERVTVRRDGRSIPYIEAKTDADLYFMQGFTTASDRLWQMDLLRRVARGETAEIFGRATLEEDKKWRRYGFARISEQSLQYLEPELRAALENYARGVNAYIALLTPETTPIEFKILQYKPREWTPADTVVIGKILAEALSSTYAGDLLRDATKNLDSAKLADLNNKITPYDVVLFGKDMATEATEVRKASNGSIEKNTHLSESRNQSSEEEKRSPDSVISVAEEDLRVRERSLSRVGLFAEGLAASNNWVISGKRTADGKSLLANDPHLLASSPGIWYLTHLSTPTMRVAGVTFPGVPGVVLGHNEHIAWGATNVGPDVQDVYSETFNEKGEYKTPDGWAAATVRKEEIKVRTNPLNPATTIETFNVTETRNGPIIIDSGEQKISLKWTAFDPKNADFNAFYSLNRAKDWNGFKSSLSSYGGAMQNFVYADTKGNIGWYAAGKLPVRRKGDGSLPYDGTSADGDWVGFVPFAELPNLYNPSEGFIVTANQRIAGTVYKHQQLVRDFAPPWRARRLFDLLSKDTKASMDSVSAAQHDVFNIPLKMLAEDIVAMKAASNEYLKLIGDWDGKMTPESQTALIVNEIRTCASNKIAADNPGVPAYIIRERILFWAIRERSPRWLPKGVTDYPTLLRGCSDSIPAAFTSRYGADAKQWVWGKTSAARFPHPLAVAPLIGGQFMTPNTPIAGSGQTPNVASFVSMRHIASPGNWDATRLVIPLGQSGDPRSLHYKDQFDSWSKGTPAVFPFSAEAVRRATVSTVAYGPQP
jgi:penicillin amidase